MSDTTTPNFRKEGNARVADLPAVSGLEFEMLFEQKRGGGVFGRIRNAVAPADPDLVAAVFVGSSPVDYVEPKHRRSVLNGTVVHRGDAAGNGIETLAVNVQAMLADDDDIDGIAIGGICPGDEGFSRVAGVTVRVYDTSTGQRQQRGVVRFDITTSYSGVLIATVKKTPTGWQIRNEPQYCRADDADMLVRDMRRYMS